MEVLKRKNEIEVIEDSKRTKKNEDSSDSEDEDDLLQRLFGSSKQLEQKTPELIEDIQEDTNEENEVQRERIEDKEDECIWHDEDDDQETKKAAQTRFSEINSGWLNLKKSSDE